MTSSGERKRKPVGPISCTSSDFKPEIHYLNEKKRVMIEQSWKQALLLDHRGHVRGKDCYIYLSISQSSLFYTFKKNTRGCVQTNSET